MSMGIILNQVRSHLREALTLSSDQCDIQPSGIPPEAAGEWYLAIDELGVASEARDHLAEEFAIEVSIWRRLGQFPADRRGEALLPESAYLAAMHTLDGLERRVILSLHGNFGELVSGANAAVGAGQPGGGDVFQLALYYEGRGRAETLPRTTGRQQPQWIGRRLKFRGMNRVQSLSIAS
jgi:hypothetical protein